MPRRLNIAIIGAGLSGLGAALMLRKKHDITIFEDRGFIGGQNNSIQIALNTNKNTNEEQKTAFIDTGFYAFNERTSPNIKRIFDKYSIPYEKTKLDYSYTAKDGKIEFSSAKKFGTISNLLNPKHWHMLRSKTKFNNLASSFAIENEQIRISDFIEKNKIGKRFANNYFLPLTAGIWNSMPNSILDFDSQNCFSFLQEQGALNNFKDQNYYIGSGGCVEFVKQASNKLKEHIRLNTKIEVVQRLGQGIMVNKEKFDHVVFATHADTTLNLLKSPTIAEKQVLSQYRYSKNHIVIHQDESLMPKRKKLWSSINCSSDNDGKQTITYWMNRVQKINSLENVFLSVNPSIEPINILAQVENKVPIFDMNAVKSRSYFGEIQNLDRITFCGSWQGNGKMEDAFTSGIAAAGHIISKWG